MQQGLWLRELRIRIALPTIRESDTKVSIYITQCSLSNGLLVHSNSRTPLHSLFTDICEHHDYDSEQVPPIGPNNIVVDIGANIGLFSLLAATISPDVTVHAFEPAPDSFALLQKNIAANGCINIHPHQYAVSGKTGEMDLYLDSGSLGDSTIEEWVGRDNIVGRERVQCISLDDLFAHCGLTFCDYLKIDCEGSEFDLLFSASSETLGKVRTIAVEYHEHRGRKGSDLAQLLKTQGFHTFEKRSCPNAGMLYALKSPAGPQERMSNAESPKLVT
jgi:FkbM family methyltransferase